jgi:MFS family permease
LSRPGGLLRNVNFALLLGGRGISEFGDAFGELAIAWVVYTVTGSVFSLGLAWLLFLVPRSLVRLFGGVYVDRFSRRGVMVFTEVMRGVLFGSLALVVLEGFEVVALVYLVSFLVGLLGSLFDFTTEALLPSLVPTGELVKANSFLTSTFQADSVLGPAAAGIVIGVYGVPASLMVDSLSFFVLVGALLMIRYKARVPAAAEQRSWLESFREGWRFFKERKELVSLAVLVAGINFGLGAFWYVYAIVYASAVLGSGSTGYGLINAFSALGILVSSVYIGKRGLKRRRAALVFSLISMGAWITALSFVDSLTVALGVIFLFGLGVPFVAVTSTSYYQEIVPDEMRGRVFGVRHFFDYLAVPAGIVFGVFATQYVGVSLAILVSGAFMLAFGAAGVAAGSLRRLDRVLPGLTSPHGLEEGPGTGDDEPGI